MRRIQTLALGALLATATLPVRAEDPAPLAADPLPLPDEGDLSLGVRLGRVPDERTGSDWVRVTLPGQVLLVRDGTALSLRARADRGVGGVGPLFLRALDLDVAPYLRVSDVLGPKDVGLGGLRLDGEGIAVRTVLWDVPVLNRVPLLRRAARLEKTFRVERVERLPGGGIRLRVPGLLPDIDIEVDERRHLLVQGHDAGELPAQVPGDFLEAFTLPPDLGRIHRVLAPLIERPFPTSELGIVEEASLDLSARKGELEVWARVHIERDPAPVDGELAGEVAVEAGARGQLPDSFRWAGGGVVLETGQEGASVSARGRYRLSTATELRAAIARAALEGELRVRVRLDLARVDLPGLLAALEGSVDLAVEARGERQEGGQAAARVGVELALAPGTRLRLERRGEPAPLELRLGARGEGPGGTLKATARVETDGGGRPRIAELRLEDLSLAAEDLAAVLPERLRAEVGEGMVHLQGVEAVQEDGVLVIRWDRLAVETAGGEVRVVLPRGPNTGLIPLLGEVLSPGKGR